MTDEIHAERAAQAWSALATCLAHAPHGQLVVKDGPRRGAPLAALWPFGQVLAAATALLPLGLVSRDEVVEPLLRSLERYRSGNGYGPFPGDRTRYYDDNAWIALDLVQLSVVTSDERYLAAAAELFELIAEGEDDAGGVRWVEGSSSRNTCSTGPAAELALRLYDASSDERYLSFARRQLAFLDQTLRDEAGLYRDHIDASEIEPTIWSYNQGTPIGAAVLMARVTGEQSWLDQAVRTARATDAHFAAEDRWWGQPPVFNAVHFRNVLALVAVAGGDDLLATLDGYLDRVWSKARDRRSGLLVGGGIGSYDGRPTIDQAGLVQLCAFRAWPRVRWPDIC